MAQRAAPHREGEPEGDAWSNTWGDQALQELGRRLESYGIAEEQAALIVEQTWLFYSYVALPELRERVPMGIASAPATSLPSVYFYLPFRWPENAPEQEPGDDRFWLVQQRFSTEFAAPLAECINLRLEQFPASERWSAQHSLQNVEALELRMQMYARANKLDYVGLFVDDLVAELGTVMDPESVPRWLDTPNSLFSWRRPAEFLDHPLDRRLRGVITRAKFNLPAA